MASKNGNYQNDSDTLNNQNIAQHVAIIMDGNGRWAKSRFLPRVEGHRVGAKTVKGIVAEARRSKIRYLTLFAFSTENWYRPGEEVSSLMKLFLYYLENEVEDLIKNDIRLRVIGDVTRLPQSIQKAIARSSELTAGGKSLDLILAISYGARDEIVNATKRIVEDCINGKMSISEINEGLFSRYLYTEGIPDPDLLIRTSGENRISNFLLWQLAYSEIVVSQVLWPDFNATEFQRCLTEYASRERRFGLTEKQIINETPKERFRVISD